MYWQIQNADLNDFWLNAVRNPLNFKYHAKWWHTVTATLIFSIRRGDVTYRLVTFRVIQGSEFVSLLFVIYTVNMERIVQALGVSFTTSSVNRHKLLNRNGECYSTCIPSVFQSGLSCNCHKPCHDKLFTDKWFTYKCFTTIGSRSFSF